MESRSNSPTGAITADSVILEGVPALRAKHSAAPAEDDRAGSPRTRTGRAPGLPAEEVRDLDDPVVEAVGERHRHDDPERDRRRRGALGVAAALGAAVGVHRHVAHEWLPVVVVPRTADGLTGSPSREKR